MKRHLSPARVIGSLLVLVAIAAAVLWFTPSSQYILLPDKARSVGPLVSVGRHATRERDAGSIYFLAVIVRKATLFERLFPEIRTGATLVPAAALRPKGVSEQAQHQIDEREMVRSQDVAAALALQAAGFKVEIRRDGARIAQVIPGTPAARALQATEVIVAVDGRPVRTPADLRRLIRSGSPGKTVRLSVRNDREVRIVTLRTAADPQERSRAMIGVIVDQAGAVHLPFPVRIDPGNVVGPSAGLAFALEVMEKVGRDVDRGYRIAATGELELDGTVAPIGGVKQKAIEAKQSHVDILLLPVGDKTGLARRYAGDVRVLPVQSFRQALRKLATLPPKG